MIYVSPLFSTHSLFFGVDPTALLVFPLMVYASDVHAILAIGASVSELGTRLRSFLYKLLCGRLGSA